jgi:MFS family permease
MSAVAGNSLRPAGGIALRAAFAISSTGDWIYKFAVPTLILNLTGSAPATAFAYVLEFLPYVLIGPFAGVLADRWSRRGTMVACDLSSCGLALALAGLIWAGRPPIVALYLTAFVLASVRPLYFPAFQGFVVETVSEDARPRFNSWTQLIDGLLSSGGPVVGAGIVAALGASLATALDAASFAASAALVATIAYQRTARPVATPRTTSALRGMLGELAEGFRAIGISRPILAGLILITGANLAAYVIEGNLVFLLLHAEHQLKVSLGVVFSVQGIGAIIGAAVAPRLLSRVRAGTLLALGLGLSGAAMAIPAAYPRFPGIVAGQAVEGAATALIVVCWYSAVQRLIPEYLIGRFVAVVRAIGFLVIPIGALLGAWLLDASGEIRVLFVCAVSLQMAIVLATTRSALLHVDIRQPDPGNAEPVNRLGHDLGTGGTRIHECDCDL